MEQEDSRLHAMLCKLRNKRCLFLLAIVANMAPLGLCYLYDMGSTVLYLVFPLVHVLLFWLNNKCSTTWLQIIFLELLYISVTACTHLQCDWLYRYYICDDLIGRAIGEGLMVVGTGIAIVLTIVSMVKFYRNQKAENDFYCNGKEHTQ